MVGDQKDLCKIQSSTFMAIAFGRWCNEGRNRRRGGKAGRNNPQKDAAVGARFGCKEDLRVLEVVLWDVG